MSTEANPPADGDAAALGSTVEPAGAAPDRSKLAVATERLRDLITSGAERHEIVGALAAMQDLAQRLLDDQLEHGDSGGASVSATTASLSDSIGLDALLAAWADELEPTGTEVPSGAAGPQEDPFADLNLALVASPPAPGEPSVPTADAVGDTGSEAVVPTPESDSAAATVAEPPSVSSGAPTAADLDALLAAEFDYVIAGVVPVVAGQGPVDEVAALPEPVAAAVDVAPAPAGLEAGAVAEDPLAALLSAELVAPAPTVPDAVVDDPELPSPDTARADLDWDGPTHDDMGRADTAPAVTATADPAPAVETPAAEVPAAEAPVAEVPAAEAPADDFEAALASLLAAPAPTDPDQTELPMTEPAVAEPAAGPVVEPVATAPSDADAVSEDFAAALPDSLAGLDDLLAEPAHPTVSAGDLLGADYAARIPVVTAPVETADTEAADAEGEADGVLEPAVSVPDAIRDDFFARAGRKPKGRLRR